MLPPKKSGIQGTPKRQQTIDESSDYKSKNKSISDNKGKVHT